MNTNHPTQPNPILDPLERLQAVDNLDQILANEAPILPTSGFALSVMDSIRTEATQPASKFSSAIHFPWARILPGAILALALLIWLLWKFSAALLAELNSGANQLAQPAHIQLTTSLTTFGWLLLALTASLLPLLLIRKLMGSSELL